MINPAEKPVSDAAADSSSASHTSQSMPVTSSRTTDPNLLSPNLFQPRVLRPRRRRARSHDYGTATSESLVERERDAVAPLLVRCESLQDMRSDQASPRSPTTGVEDADSINAKFEKLLDTYIFGGDGPNGKVVRRKIKGTCVTINF